MSGSLKLRVDDAWQPFTDSLLSSDRYLGIPTLAATSGIPNGARVGSDGGLYVPRAGFRYGDLGVAGNPGGVLTDIVIGTSDTSGTPDIMAANAWEIGWVGGDQVDDYGLALITGELAIGVGGSIGANPKIGLPPWLVSVKHGQDDDGSPAGNCKMQVLHDNANDPSGRPGFPFLKGCIHMLSGTTFTFLVEVQDAATGFTHLRPINTTTPFAWAPGSIITYDFLVFGRRK